MEEYKKEEGREKGREKGDGDVKWGRKEAKQGRAERMVKQHGRRKPLFYKSKAETMKQN